MTWKLDPTHTQIQFSVRHMMISTVRGTFQKYEADATIDPSAIGKSKVVAKVEAASINTGEAQRDAHLKSADFFDADNFSHLTLESTKVTTSGDEVTIDANLTIKGITKPIQLKGEVLGPHKDPWGNQRIGFSVSGELEREDFGLSWNQALEAGGVLVGKKVKINLDAQFVQS